MGPGDHAPPTPTQSQLLSTSIVRVSAYQL
ncbi:hypothetical protein NC651_007406 [Populus alba x Populus x berolinensis]|nr:hypothetical protein NC651_007406 [Populus alba x Populus x berolinensis]